MISKTGCNFDIGRNIKEGSLGASLPEPGGGGLKDIPLFKLHFIIIQYIFMRMDMGHGLCTYAQCTNDLHFMWFQCFSLHRDVGNDSSWHCVTAYL